jgi:hypothetical protein
MKEELLFFRMPHFLVVEAGGISFFTMSKKFYLQSHSIFDASARIQIMSFIGQASAFFLIVFSWVDNHLENPQKENEGFWEHICFSKAYMINYLISQLCF